VKDMEIIRSKTLLKTMFSFERFFFKHSDWVSTISVGMEKKISSKGLSKTRLILFPNWVDSSFVAPVRKEDSLRDRFGLNQTDRVVLYSGNLGEKQGLEMIVELADRMKTQLDIKFVIVGSGGAKVRLQQMVESFSLKNVLFYPLQPYADLPKLLAVADVHLVLQKKEASDLVMPSKLTGILSTGGLALITALPETTLYEEVTKHNMGVVVEPGSIDALHSGLVSCLDMKTDSCTIRENARKYALRHLDRDAVLTRFEHKLLNYLKE